MSIEINRKCKVCGIQKLEGRDNPAHQYCKKCENKFQLKIIGAYSVVAIVVCLAMFIFYKMAG